MKIWKTILLYLIFGKQNQMSNSLYVDRFFFLMPSNISMAFLICEGGTYESCCLFFNLFDVRLKRFESFIRYVLINRISFNKVILATIVFTFQCFIRNVLLLCTWESQRFYTVVFIQDFVLEMNEQLYTTVPSVDKYRL